jgi:hypothetical protein
MFRNLNSDLWISYFRSEFRLNSVYSFRTCAFGWIHLEKLDRLSSFHFSEMSYCGVSIDDVFRKFDSKLSFPLFSSSIRSINFILSSFPSIIEVNQNLTNLVFGWRGIWIQISEFRISVWIQVTKQKNDYSLDWSWKVALTLIFFISLRSAGFEIFQFSTVFKNLNGNYLRNTLYLFSTIEPPHLFCEQYNIKY